jgi:penicillin-binding protein 1A
MQSKFGDVVYTAGYKVFTAIDSRLQAAATVALRTGLMEYDRRHGYRGATAKVDLSKITTAAGLDAQLEEFPIIGGLKPAIVEKVEAKSAKIYVKDLGVVDLPWEKLAWARRELPEEKVDRPPTQASEILSRGDVIYTVGRSAESLMFVQVPEAQSALVSVDPKDGAIVALVGGFDFFQSKYNRVTQARRQPGSGFKPFVYAAAFEKGFTPASVILDAPVVIDEQGNEKSWRPREDTDRFYGPVRLREALVHSRNLVSVRLMRAITLDYARNYVTRFGFDKSQLPDDLTLALGTAELSPLQVAIGYSTFANGGFKVSSYYIDRVEDAAGKAERGTRPGLMDEAPHDGKTLIPSKNLAPRILSPQIAYLLADMMADVIKRGTGQRARTLNRDDIAGKTGTTSEFHDAWFSGFNADIVTTVWTGFDADRSLGDNDDQAARVAVPTWTYFMHDALAGTARHPMPVPEGIVSVRISPQTGLLASSDNPNGIMEKFIEGNLPKSEVYEGNATNPVTDGDKPLF